MNKISNPFTHTLSYLVIGALVLVFLLHGCRRDDYYDGDDVVIGLSTDTLRFDTVFTTVGSATRIVKLYNPKDQPVLIDVSLAGKTNGIFRFNADGVKGPEVKNLEILANDSIYVFIETTIDPNLPLSVSPYIVEDQILITVNGSKTTLYLEAWGQNANYIPSSKKGGGFPYLSCDFGTVTWDDPKPYVIYGVLVIDSCTLVLPAGTRLYVHGGIVRNKESIYNDGLIAVASNGKIIANGTLEQPVTLQGDRLEEEFANESGQWVGVLFSALSRGNKMVHTHIRNSIIGVRVDSLASLSLDKCKIFNTAGAGIIGRHSTISASNCLIYNNGSYAAALTYGGNYSFDYCTMATYSGQDEALAVTDFYCNDILCSDGIWFNAVNASFKNCIITGSSDDEILLNRRDEATPFQVNFDHCAFPAKDILAFEGFDQMIKDCTILKRADRVFNDHFREDYSLDTMSVLLNKALVLPSITDDIKNKLRKITPDPGCYEF
jgi:hypothetical protein